jgi:hypothetical protein
MATTTNERSVSPDEVFALALKVIIQYLIASGIASGSSLEQMANDRLGKITPLSSGIDPLLNLRIHQFLGIPGQQKLIQGGRKYRAPVEALLASRDIGSFPLFVRAAIEQAGLVSVSPQAAAPLRPNGVPRLVNVAELVRERCGTDFLAPIIEQYEGCWRVYRLSSQAVGGASITDPADARISVGFLNIKPLSVLRAETAPLPEFAFYQRSDTASGPRTLRSKTYGTILHGGRFITLLGEREGGRQIGDSGLLTWIHHQPQDEMDDILGISCMPNSEGHEMVAAYFCAVFIAGSRGLTDAEYDALRIAETSPSALGTRAWGDVRRGLDKNTQHTIETMIRNSLGDTVFGTHRWF